MRKSRKDKYGVKYFLSEPSTLLEATNKEIRFCKIWSSTEIITAKVFENFKQLYTVSFPDTCVKTIQEDVFIGCAKLETIYILKGTMEYFRGFKALEKYQELLKER